MNVDAPYNADHHSHAPVAHMLIVRVPAICLGTFKNRVMQGLRDQHCAYPKQCITNYGLRNLSKACVTSGNQHRKDSVQYMPFY